MELQAIIGFGIAVSLPVWLVIEEISRRRNHRMTNRSERKIRVRGERQREDALKRRAPAALSGQAMSRLSVAAEV
jgi:hypothetical protein